MFRGERAITEFDKPFTPSHSSSTTFSTGVGSDLHPVLPGLHPGHGELTRIRVYRVQLNRPVQTRFRYGSVPAALSLAAHE
jgi:hypothetical protein